MNAKLKVALTMPAMFLGTMTMSRRLAPQPGENLAPGYYIVVAAYKQGQVDYAQRYMNKINEGGLHSSFGLDTKRHLLLVYLDYYTDFQESIQEMLKVRQAGGFGDAWVRVLKDNGDAMVSTPATTQKDQSAPPAKVTPPVSTASNEPGPSAEESKPADQQAFVPIEVIDNPDPEPVIPPQILSNTPVFLSLYNARNNKVIDGEVEVVDTDRARLISKVKANDYITLPDPKSNSGTLTLICNVFGYRPVEHQMNYLRTEADTLKDFIDLVGNYYMVNFDLVRLHRGDISTLYNVYFYNDAAVMLPESQYQLNSLLQMMQENKSMKIRLHGHTNGNAKGKIITMGPSRNFFALSDDVKEGFGSAKKLSGERAEVIRQWLIDQGISPDRIETKAWGGSRMVHEKNSVNAKKNVRVDVEVIEE